MAQLQPIFIFVALIGILFPWFMQIKRRGRFTFLMHDYQRLPYIIGILINLACWIIFLSVLIVEIQVVSRFI